MIMEFNFGNMSETSFVGSQVKHFKAYDIYEVTLSKIAIDNIKGVKDPTANYQVVTIEFTGTDKNPGIFTTNLFFPQATKDDLERPTFKNANGHEYQRPSRFENFKYTLMQIAEVLNPDGAAKVKSLAPKFKTVEDFVKAIVKILEGKNKVITNLKLVGRNNNGSVYAALPNACGLTKEGEIYPVNFLGENLYFSAYEEGQRKNMNNAKPTPVATDNQEEDGGSLDDLLNEIN